MKKVMTCWLIAFFAIAMYAQKDVTTFLGIPVDGYKSEMRQKLIAKGYVPKKFGDEEHFERVQRYRRAYLYCHEQ